MMALPMLAGLAFGPLLKWGALALGAALVIGGALWGVVQYGEQRAELAQLRQLGADNVRQAARQAEDLRGQIATLERVSDASAARAANLAANLERVRHAKNSRACAGSAAVRAALDGLRRSAGRDPVGDAGSDDPGQPVDLSRAPGGSPV